MSNRVKKYEKTDHENPIKDDEGMVGDASLESEDSRGQAGDAGPSKKENAGLILKRAREAKGVSLEIVHEATKIPLDALRAIEEGYKVRMLSPFYYSGFIKMYAAYLHVDISDVIENYKPEELPETIPQTLDGDFKLPPWFAQVFTRERKQQIVIGLGALLAVFVFFKFVGFVKSFQRHPKAKQEAKAPSSKEVKKEIKKVAEIRKEVKRDAPKIIAPKITPKKIEPKKIAEVAPKTKPPVQPAVVQQEAPKPVQKVSVVAPAAVQKNITLTVRANQNSWLRVKSDGQVVFQSTLRMGAVETWLADNEIEIAGRNINQLEFELNGKMIGMLGRKDRNAKKVVFNENGLSVKQ